MRFSVLGTCVVMLAFQAHFCATQDCTLADLDQDINGAISGAVSLQGGPPNVEVFGYRVVCLGAGQTRDTYTFTSIVANYSCDGGHVVCQTSTADG